MLAGVRSYALEGLEGYGVDVEVDVTNGIPAWKRSDWLQPPRKSPKRGCAPPSRTADCLIRRGA